MADREQEMRDRMEADMTRPKVLWGGEPRDGALAFYECLAKLKEAQEELHAKAVCDCHTWPTIKEFHEYTVAVEAQRDAAIERGSAAFRDGVVAHRDATYFLKALADYGGTRLLERAEAAERDAAEKGALLQEWMQTTIVLDNQPERNRIIELKGLTHLALTPAKAQEESDR